MEKLLLFLKNQIRDGFFNSKVINPEEISAPIVQAINKKEYETVNPDSISSPIVNALEELKDAIPEMPKEMVVSNLQEITSVLLEAVSKMDKTVVVDQKAPKVEVKFDEKKIVSSLKDIEKKLKEDIDYTPILSELCDLVEQSKTIIDLNKVEVLLAEIFSKPSIPVEDGRVPIQISDEQLKKMGKHIGGFYPTDHSLKDTTGAYINPATKEKQDEIIDTLENLDITVNASDIEIGAVEIKNSTDDTRATVGANGLYVDIRDSVLPTDAATQTTLALIKTKTDNLDIALSGIKTGTDKIISAPATEAKQLADNHQVTVSNIASTPVITGFATEATLGLVSTNTNKLLAKKITVSGTTVYVAQAVIGTAQSSAAWQAKKIATTAGTTTITWADGDALYNNVATDLTILNYS